MDLSNVPSEATVIERLVGIIQNGEGSQVATMVEYYYNDLDTGNVIIIGYDITLNKNGTTAWSGSVNSQSEAVQISKTFVDQDITPN